MKHKAEWKANHIFEIQKSIKAVKTLNNSTPNGVIVDADTLLADAIEDCDHEITGLAKEIFAIWEGAWDKDAVERMFLLFTGLEFSEYLNKCKEEITKNE